MQEVGLVCRYSSAGKKLIQITAFWDPQQWGRDERCHGKNAVYPPPGVITPPAADPQPLRAADAWGVGSGERSDPPQAPPSGGDSGSPAAGEEDPEPEGADAGLCSRCPPAGRCVRCGRQWPAITPTSPPDSDDARPYGTTPGFSRFWEALPRHLRQAKAKTWDTWQRKQLEDKTALQERIQRALKVQRADRAWLARNDRMTARSYLASARWEDVEFPAHRPQLALVPAVPAAPEYEQSAASQAALAEDWRQYFGDAPMPTTPDGSTDWSEAMAKVMHAGRGSRAGNDAPPEAG